MAKYLISLDVRSLCLQIKQIMLEENTDLSYDAIEIIQEYFSEAGRAIPALEIPRLRIALRHWFNRQLFYIDNITVSNISRNIQVYPEQQLIVVEVDDSLAVVKQYNMKGDKT